MISVTPNPQNLAARLFTDKTFDNFLLAEASFATDYIVSVDGSCQRKAVGDPENAAPETGAESHIRWKSFRPVALQLVRGTRPPQAFHIVLMLSRRKLQDFITASRCEIDPEDVAGLYINLRFQEEKLTVTTGCALKIFTPDRTLENAWDRQVENFIGKL